MTEARGFSDYKETGLKWLGRVPTSWDIVPLWTLYSRRKSTNFPDEELLSVYRDHGVVLKNSRDDNFNKPSDDLSSYQLVNPGDMVINKMKAWQGSVAISRHRGIVSPAYFVYERHHSMDDRYLHYLLRSERYITGYLSLSKGIRINQWDLDPTYHSRMPVLVPSMREQRNIVNILDRETARIDELIGKQERLIELLAEKREAVITHAVAKGLNPTAPTKSSTVPWLGDIPSHWTEKPMCHFMAGRVDYRGATPKKTDHGIFLVTAKNVRKGYIDYAASTEYVGLDDYDNVMSRGRPALGDILMTMEAPLGNFALVDDPGVALAQRVIKFRPKADLVPEFSVYAMNCPYFQAQLEERATGSTALGIKASKLIELRLVAPSIAEQQRIVDYLDSRTGRIEALTRRSGTAVKLLSERRSALISAAVTGKIDTRKGSA